MSANNSIYRNDTERYWFVGGTGMSDPLVVNTIVPTNYSLAPNSGKLNLTNATLSAISGGNSGQHLQININGVDYKIRLENP